MKKYNRAVILFLLFIPGIVFALAFPIPSKNTGIVGAVQNVQVQVGDDYSTIARKYDIGYYELFEANPGVEPDNPKVGTILIIPTQYILPPKLKNNIVINLAEMRLYYYSSKTNKIYTYPIGIGKEGWVTPTGVFKVVDKIESPSWIVPESIFKYRAANGDPVPKVVPPGPDNPLGDYALRLSDRTYLIHGTDDPVGIGRRSSAGCIRMYPEDIKELFGMVKKGTVVKIINVPYKIGKIGKHVYIEAHMPLKEQRDEVKGNLPQILDNEIKKIGAENINRKSVLQIAKDHIGIPLAIG